MKMKQKIGAGALLAIVAIGGVYGVGSVQAANSSTSNNTQKQFIGIEMAEQKALAVAKGQVESIELKKYNTQVYYKVEIDQGQKDVDVLIEAYTGKSLGVRTDHDDNDDKEDDYKYTNATSTASGSNIGASKASAVAVNYLKGTVIEVDLDRDDGRLVYEVELKIDGGTAEVKVDAKTAKIVSVDKDFDDHDDNDDDDNNNDD
ncbi:PepSY domain-containing protein [Paenibacillus glacialis]|uniref:PepSY domain-containing protein n=1 Tax=Paenibacillus glacialis TaxID=494026 RepID=A0A168FT15_9BACL|nr:PepSY domain-containing protein [Paenibacillus glacialis]OAB36514.1 hypothetical protein PGLA_20870 [Paenibacillus glacialis]